MLVPSSLGGEGQGGVEALSMDLVHGSVATFPPHAGPLPWGRENRPPRFRQSKAPRLVAARGAVFPLPAGEGQGEGERDPANPNGRTNFASSTRPDPRLRVGYHIERRACRWSKGARSQA